MFFVIQKKRTTAGAWTNGVIVKETLNEALHQFHAFMSTYAYGQDASLDYCACEVQTRDGRNIKSEIDDRIAPAASNEPEEA